MVKTARAVSWFLLSAWVAAAVPARGQSSPGAAGADDRIRSWEKQLILPQKIASRLSWAERRLQPSGRRRLESMGRALAPAAASGDDTGSLRERAEAEVIAAYPALGSMDVSEAAFIVLSMAAEDMDEDIRLVIAEIKAMNAAKQKMRDMIKDLNEWISQEMSKQPGSKDIDNGNAAGSKTSSRAPQPPAKPSPVPVRRITLETRASPVARLEYVKAPAVPPLPPRNPGLSAAALGALLDDVEGNLDGMNEMSEMTSLRLQTTMDRRSKFIETLSNLMKKIGTTQESLAQNIK
jgi:hypothetical protein